MPTNHDAVLAKYRALWLQIATRFRDHSDQLMFESINEPNFTGVSDAVKRVVRTRHYSSRSSPGSHPPSYETHSSCNLRPRRIPGGDAPRGIAGG